MIFTHLFKEILCLKISFAESRFSNGFCKVSAVDYFINFATLKINATIQQFCCNIEYKLCDHNFNYYNFFNLFKYLFFHLFDFVEK